MVELVGDKQYLFWRGLTLIMAAVFFVISINPVFLHLKTSDWPKVHGAVVVSQLAVEEKGLLGIFDVYNPDIRFVYQVGNNHYEGDRIQYGVGVGSFLFKRYAQNVVQRYPLKKVVTVYYDPDDPENEIVERSPALGFSLVWIALFVFFVGLSVLISFKRREMLAALDRPDNRSLRPDQKTEADLFKDHYPSPVYNPAHPLEGEPNSPTSGQVIHSRRPLTSDELKQLEKDGYLTAV
ncbi:DUF3592 domain-containing protein, partial [Magnetococcales bacterium HHB-1]